MFYTRRQTTPERGSRQFLCAFLCATVLALLLGGCASSPRETAKGQFYQSLIGRSITDVTTETGVIPDTAFDNEHGQRVFMYRNAFGGACTIIKARHDGKAFRIVEVIDRCA